MIKINEVIVAEGKYDKIKLSRLFDTLIITTDGFRIYKDRHKAELIKAAAKKRGIIIITDSDRAGFRIRSTIRRIVGDINVKNVYIPQIEGKEKRKDKPSAEGYLGVEGIPDDVLINAVMSQTVSVPDTDKITKAELYSLGLIGGENSAALRDKLAAAMSLPRGMSSQALLDTVNVLFGKDEFYAFFRNMM